MVRKVKRRGGWRHTSGPQSRRRKRVREGTAVPHYFPSCQNKDRMGTMAWEIYRRWYTTSLPYYIELKGEQKLRKERGIRRPNDEKFENIPLKHPIHKEVTG